VVYSNPAQQPASCPVLVSLVSSIDRSNLLNAAYVRLAQGGVDISPAQVLLEAITCTSVKLGSPSLRQLQQSDNNTGFELSAEISINGLSGNQALNVSLNIVYVLNITYKCHNC
jgi:hypothetical protein